MDLKKKQWQDMYRGQIELLQQIMENPIPLRFEKNCIGVSDIAGQYYCEQNIELKYLHGDIDTEEKLFGRDAHGKLIEGFKKISLKKAWRHIFSSPLYAISEFLFLAKYNSLFFAFIPDRIIFEKGIPKLLIEFKFSKHQIPFKTYHVQLQSEALLLKAIGFNTDKLYYSIIIAPRDPKGGPFFHSEVRSAFQNKMVSLIYHKLKNNQQTDFHFNFREINTYTYPFSYTKAEENLKWAMGFWTEEREAVPTTNKNKCRRCEYRNSCEESLI